jgi:hypothetical protein
MAACHQTAATAENRFCKCRCRRSCCLRACSCRAHLAPELMTAACTRSPYSPLPPNDGSSPGWMLSMARLYADTSSAGMSCKHHSGQSRAPGSAGTWHRAALKHAQLRVAKHLVAHVSASASRCSALLLPSLTTPNAVPVVAKAFHQVLASVADGLHLGQLCCTTYQPAHPYGADSCCQKLAVRPEAGMFGSCSGGVLAVIQFSHCSHYCCCCCCCCCCCAYRFHNPP